MEDILTFVPEISHFLTGCIGAYVYFFCIKYEYGLPDLECKELNDHSALTKPGVRYTFIVIGGLLALFINFNQSFVCFCVGFLHRYILLAIFTMRSDIIKKLIKLYLDKK